MTMGRIHSWESMGLVDGPGIRTVIFLQGCSLRCQYCHNPDTWDMCGNADLESPEKVVERLKRFKPYYGTEGGVTFSGGEPLIQKEFLNEVLQLCKQEGINTCIDTSGVGIKPEGAGASYYDEVLKNTDLIIFDIKHYTEESYREITGHDISESLEFLDRAQEFNIPLWIRHVVVPGLTDGEEHLKGLHGFIKSLKNVKRTELLPYHVLGVNKYRAMGIHYRLEGVQPKKAEELTAWQKIMNE